MKILKEGKVVTTFVGQCDSCRSVLECERKELDVDDSGEIFYQMCNFCNESNIVFHKVNTKTATGILRKNNLKALYK